MDPVTQLLLSVAAILLFCALLIIFLRIRQYRANIEALAKAMDGRPEVVSTLSSRIYLLHAVHNKLKFRCSFRPQVKSDLPEFAVSMYGTFPGGLSIRRGAQSGSRITRAGAAEDIQTGDAEFDRLFTIRARQGHSTHDFLEDPSRRTLIMKLLNRADSGLFLEGTSARAVFRGLELAEIRPGMLAELLDRMAGLTV